MQITWDVTHVVKEEHGSLFGSGGFEEAEIGPAGELARDEKLVIDDEDIFTSRGSSNQEDARIRGADEQSAPAHNWYRVLYLKDRDTSTHDLYVREGTFAPAHDDLTGTETSTLAALTEEHDIMHRALGELFDGAETAERKSERVNAWLARVKRMEAADTFAAAFQQGRMTVRQVDLNPSGKGGEWQPPSFWEKGQSTGTKTNTLDNSQRGIEARMRGPEAAPFLPGGERVNEHGLHDLSASLLDPAKPISGQLKFYRRALMVFMPMPPESDHAIFSALMRLHVLEPESKRILESVFTHMSLAQGSDMGASFADVSGPDAPEGDFRYGLTGRIQRPGSRLGTAASQAELVKRRTNTMTYSQMVNTASVNEVVLAYRSHASADFPLYAIRESKDAPFPLVDATAGHAPLGPQVYDDGTIR